MLGARRTTLVMGVLLATGVVTAGACGSGPGTEESISSPPDTTQDEQALVPVNRDNPELAALRKRWLAGRETFRHETFGDEIFWSSQLKLNRAIAGKELGGVGPGLSPKDALKLGLKVDVEALPDGVLKALRTGQIDLKDPAVTMTLLSLDAVVGLKAFFDEEEGSVARVGVTCALCHSTVDDSFAPGIGHRLDGWPNRSLNVGAIVSLAPNLDPIANALGVDVATVKTVLGSWGRGKYDALLLLDGKAFQPDGRSAATLLPPAFSQAGTNLATYTGFGSTTYWNAYVAVTQMHGFGRFYDPRLADPVKYPISAKNGTYDIRPEMDAVTPKLADLHFYQLSLQPPAPEEGSFDAEAAARGALLFEHKGQCASCHSPTTHTDPGWNLHTAEEIGIDDFQSSRSPDNMYRTTPLAGFAARKEGGFYHDGRFATLSDVIRHYDTLLKLDLTEAEVNDLEQYLRSL